MKVIWTKYKTLIIGIGVLLLVVYLLFYFIDKRDKTYKIERATLEAEYNSYKLNYFKAMDIVSKLQLTVDSLQDVKSKIHIKYEEVIKEFGNPYIISNDSITKYISTKIHNKR